MTGRRDRRSPERLRALGRGLLARCPRCGQRGIFSGFFTLRERCPRCGLRFEREEGYWLGAMAVSIGVTEGVFALLVIGVLVATWPDVPWTGLLVVALAVNAIVPVVFYPLSKTIWMGLHHAFVPPDAAEEADAATARDPRLDGA